MKVAGRIVSALLFLVVVIGTSFAVRYEQSVDVVQAERAAGVVEEVATAVTVPASSGGRGPAAYGRAVPMEYREPCREDFECADRLQCIAGRCDKLDRQGRGHIGDYCTPGANHTCISGSCGESALCEATIQEKQDNEQPCDEGAPNVCRSGVCRDKRCKASSLYLGVPGMECSTSADCLSQNCVESRSGLKVCGYSQAFQATCAPLGQKVSLPVECCSGVSDGTGRCSAVPDPDCTERGQCAGKVGRVCGDVGHPAVNPAQCCSGKLAGGRCTINVNARFQPCQLDRACRSGSCDRQTSLCERGYYGPKGGSHTNPYNYDSINSRISN